MRSILIPTDFSETAKNAANYAIDFAKQLHVNNIILFNCWQPVVLPEAIGTLTLSELEVVESISKTKLEEEKSRLQQLAPLHISFQQTSYMGSLESGVQEVVATENIAYIIMGITGGDALKEKLIGSNTISVSKIVNTPLIIVPANCRYNLITKAMLLCDYTNIVNALPEKQITEFLEVVQPNLDVVNFDPDFKREELDTALEKFYLQHVLRKFSPNYKYSLINDVEDAVNEIAENNDVQLIINIAKKHGWLYKILHPSFTKKLAFHTKLPLMVIHN